MSEYAPKAIYSLFDDVKKLIPAAQLGGIQGNAAHKYGYHRARNVLPGSDYSVTEKLDKQGDGWACSALDVTLGTGTLMHTVSKRLLAAKKDPRMAPIREFFGCIDGVHIIGWDWSTNSPTTSDDLSHRFHVHLSIHRAYANNAAVLAPVAQVLAGVKESPVVDLSAFTAPISIKRSDGTTIHSSIANLLANAEMHAVSAQSAAEGAQRLAADADKRIAALQAEFDAYKKASGQ